MIILVENIHYTPEIYPDDFTADAIIAELSNTHFGGSLYYTTNFQDFIAIPPKDMVYPYSRIPGTMVVYRRSQSTVPVTTLPVATVVPRKHSPPRYSRYTEQKPQLVLPAQEEIVYEKVPTYQYPFPVPEDTPVRRSVQVSRYQGR